jgi:hypothetical protein
MESLHLQIIGSVAIQLLTPTASDIPRFGKIRGQFIEKCLGIVWTKEFCGNDAAPGGFANDAPIRIDHGVISVRLNF